VYRWSVDDAVVDIHVTGRIVSDETTFDVRVDLDVRLDGEPFFQREWQERVPRHLV
jgi:hypothetical protein